MDRSLRGEVKSPPVSDPEEDVPCMTELRGDDRSMFGGEEKEQSARTVDQALCEDAKDVANVMGC